MTANKKLKLKDAMKPLILCYIETDIKLYGSIQDNTKKFCKEFKIKIPNN